MSVIKNKIAARLLLFILASIAISSSLMWAGDFFSKSQKETINQNETISSVPTLYIASDGTKVFVADSNLPAIDTPNIVIATHGWYEKVPWPGELAVAIKNKTDSQQWICGWFDWRGNAKVIDPIEAAQYARYIAGPMLGQKILRLSKNFRHIHLIGHSAGAWVISEAARVIAKETKTTIHLTFLDAYVPLSWQQEKLGDFSADPNTSYWADHYFTRDLTMKVTENILTYAHNVDITETTPGIYDHEFPRYWYHATVIDRYARGECYGGEKLFCRSGTIDYGFARSLEANRENWKNSVKLPLGNTAIQLKKSDLPFMERLQKLFQKKAK